MANSDFAHFARHSRSHRHTGMSRRPRRWRLELVHGAAACTASMFQRARRTSPLISSAAIQCSAAERREPAGPTCVRLDGGAERVRRLPIRSSRNVPRLVRSDGGGPRTVPTHHSRRSHDRATRKSRDISAEDGAHARRGPSHCGAGAAEQRAVPGPDGDIKSLVEGSSPASGPFGTFTGAVRSNRAGTILRRGSPACGDSPPCLERQLAAKPG